MFTCLFRLQKGIRKRRRKVAYILREIIKSNNVVSISIAGKCKRYPASLQLQRKDTEI